MRVARRAVVRGHVQGVGYRYACQRRAEASGVTGWARNHDDGTVEVHLEGEEDAVERLLAWLHEGPRLAEVDSVETRTAEPEHPVGFYTS